MNLAILALLGVVSCVNIPDNQLVRINTSAYADSDALAKGDDAKAEASDDEESSGDDDDDDDELVQLQDPCVYLDETQDELDYQVDMFSRTLDVRHWTNAQNIAKAMGKNGTSAPGLKIHTWELYNNAFSSQELEDTHSSTITWTCSSTSKITLTSTAPTALTSITSSELPSKFNPTSTPNSTTVNSLIQLPSTQKPRKTSE